MANPLRYDCLDVVANGEEPRREGFAVLGSDLARVLKNGALLKVDNAQCQRRDSVIPGPEQKRDAIQRPVAAVDVVRKFDRADDVADLPDARRRLLSRAVAMRLSSADGLKYSASV